MIIHDKALPDNKSIVFRNKNGREQYWNIGLEQWRNSTNVYDMDSYLYQIGRDVMLPYESTWSEPENS